jgi:ribosome-binding protein aMBF1 (putative translation factor)
MPRHAKTGFDKFFDAQMASPSFAKSYADNRARIEAVDEVVRRLDETRLGLGMTKAELARAISAKPEIVRRLFTTKNPNPTLETVIRLAHALGYNLQLVQRVEQDQKSAPKVTKSSQRRQSRAMAS